MSEQPIDSAPLAPDTGYKLQRDVHVAVATKDYALGVDRTDWDDLREDLEELASMAAPGTATWASSAALAFAGGGISVALSIIPMIASAKEDPEAWGLVLLAAVSIASLVIAAFCWLAHQSLVGNTKSAARRLCDRMDRIKSRTNPVGEA